MANWTLYSYFPRLKNTLDVFNNKLSNLYYKGIANLYGFVKMAEPQRRKGYVLYSLFDKPLENVAFAL